MENQNRIITTTLNKQETNMKDENLLLIGMISIALVACGGGGSAGITQPTQPTQPTIQRLQGSVSIRAVHNEKTAQSTTPIVSTNNLMDINRINFKGRSIVLAPIEMTSDINIRATQESEAQNVIVTYVKNPNYLSRFGIISELNGNDDDAIAFSQGIATPINNMPLFGTAKYNGVYTSVLTSENETFSNSTFGTVTTRVNFSDKTADVTLSKNPNVSERTIQNKIEGNKFSSADGRMQGSFYGNKAQELGGSYKEDNGVTAFGATKQKEPEVVIITVTPL